MGNCFSEEMGKRAAVCGVQGGSGPLSTGRDKGPNEAVDHLYRAQGFQPLYTPVQLSLSASKLADLDVLSKSDPMTVVYMEKRDGSLEEIGRTEVTFNTLNPAWIWKIFLSYQFEIVQPLVIIESGGAVPICKTEVVKNNLNPVWRPICLTTQQFGSKVQYVRQRYDYVMDSRPTVKLVYKRRGTSSKDK